MVDLSLLSDTERFSSVLYKKMADLSAGVTQFELYEFHYCLDNLTPATGWDSLDIPGCGEIEALIRRKEFYLGIRHRPQHDGQLVLDEQIAWLTRALFAGLAVGIYSPEWIQSLFYFDPRGFIFLPRTEYFPPAVREHLGGQPAFQLEPTQPRFETAFEIGYREFKEANLAIDRLFLDVIQALIASRGTPLLLTLLGPSAAGKTEITGRMRAALISSGMRVAAIEMDNFFKDREFRESRPVDKEVIHFELFRKCMTDLLAGKPVSAPRYDSVRAISSHDLQSRLRPGEYAIEIEPADVLLLEGNFPFQIPEIAPLIGLKIVYLTDDPIRLKRKWKRDVDFRRKYEPLYLCNRFFRTQFLRQQEVYLPMMTICDMVVDTTGAALWLTPEIRAGMDFERLRSAPCPN